MNKVFCFTGGVSRGNPGPAAIGVSVTDAAGVMIGEMARMIGNSTSSFADYQAVMAGLQLLVELLGTDSRATDIIISLENDEVKKQLNAEVPITEPGFVPLFIEIHNMRVAHFPHLTYQTITAAANTTVAELLLEALDAK